MSKTSETVSCTGLTQEQADQLHAHFDLLQREAEHRIANALQLVAASLLMQAQAADNPVVAQPLSVAAARVGAIGSLHRQLHQTNGGKGGFLDAAEMLRSTALETVAAMLEQGAAQDAVSVEAPLGGLPWPAEHAPSVALAAVELATNAIKHQAKRVVLRLDPAPCEALPAEDNSRACLLTVDDDGVGFPPGFDPSHGTPGTGLHLVRALAGVSGSLEVARTPLGGGRVIVRFDFATGPTLAAYLGTQRLLGRPSVGSRRRRGRPAASPQPWTIPGSGSPSAKRCRHKATT